jgi:enoyl-CoA hydratase
VSAGAAARPVATEEVIVTVDGTVGRLRLNRPRAIHALTQGMCEAIIAALLEWESDPAVDAVMIDHADGRGFCAGGDIRMVWESVRADGAAARTFFLTEYRMNALLFGYAKPIVTFMDGVTMGGGVGLSQPARFRVATERTIYAMPEAGIGLFPDVGSSWYLPRLPGRTGQFLAITGARLDGAECMSLGIATHYVPSERLEAVKSEIVQRPGGIEAILDDASETPPPARIDSNRARIDRLFASDRLEDIMASLEGDGSEWAVKELATIRSRSPQTMKVALRELSEGARFTTFEEAMRLEFGLAVRSAARPDFAEGVRAVLIDKDDAPRWNPPTPEAVTEALIDEIFLPLPESEAWTPLTRAGA